MAVKAIHALPAALTNATFDLVFIRLMLLLFVVLMNKRIIQKVHTGKRRGMVYGAKGQMSERDADAYALQLLRRYRRGELLPPPQHELHK